VGLVTALLAMIDLRYRKILFFQAFFLFAIGTFFYNFFKRSFGLHVGSEFWGWYLFIWVAFIAFNLLFLKFFALPTKGLLKKLESTTLPEDLSWSVIEETLSKRDVYHQLIQSEYEIENLKYKILLDSLHDPVCIIGKDLIILYSNQAFNFLFNIPEHAKKSSLLEVTRNHEFHHFVVSSITSNEAQKLNEFSFNPIQDAFKKFFEIKVFPLRDIQNYLCVMHDVTERKLADQMREDFVSNFSHEVRTPLTILNGQIQILKGHLESNEFKPIFEKIDNNSRRLLNLFNDLLTLTKVEKKKDLFKEEIHVEPIIESLAEELKVNYPHKVIKFSFDFRAPVLHVDYNLFEQVMINLIDNAYKYAGALGNVKITTRQEGDFHILEVSDDGMGIPEDQQHRIFERFFRVDVSRSSDIEGTGLGLSIVKHIIQKHDGKIKVSSQFSKGTTFTIFFPAVSNNSLI
jgi:two-component system phosphate regulon sensor histidine kinase PhoR